MITVKSTWKQRARGLKRNKRGTMNKTEQAYNDFLSLRECAGEIIWFAFEGMRFRLADGSFFAPDFDIQLADGSIELHECKGTRKVDGIEKPFFQEAAKVRLKVAAELFPFTFKTVFFSKREGRWVESEVGAMEDRAA